MNTPKPTPPKAKTQVEKKPNRQQPQKRPRRRENVKSLQKKAEDRKKLITYIVTLTSGEQVEFRAEDGLKETEIGPLVYEKHREWPVSIKKKPFAPKEHLTDRPFANLKELLKEATK